MFLLVYLFQFFDAFDILFIFFLFFFFSLKDFLMKTNNIVKGISVSFMTRYLVLDSHIYFFVFH